MSLLVKHINALDSNINRFLDVPWGSLRYDLTEAKNPFEADLTQGVFNQKERMDLLESVLDIHDCCLIKEFADEHLSELPGVSVVVHTHHV